MYVFFIHAFILFSNDKVKGDIDTLNDPYYNSYGGCLWKVFMMLQNVF